MMARRGAAIVRLVGDVDLPDGERLLDVRRRAIEPAVGGALGAGGAVAASDFGSRARDPLLLIERQIEEGARLGEYPIGNARREPMARDHEEADLLACLIHFCRDAALAGVRGHERRDIDDRYA